MAGSCGWVREGGGTAVVAAMRKERFVDAFSLQAWLTLTLTLLMPEATFGAKHGPMRRRFSVEPGLLFGPGAASLFPVSEADFGVRIFDVFWRRRSTIFGRSPPTFFFEKSKRNSVSGFRGDIWFQASTREVPFCEFHTGSLTKSATSRGEACQHRPDEILKPKTASRTGFVNPGFPGNLEPNFPVIP